MKITKNDIKRAILESLNEEGALDVKKDRASAGVGKATTQTRTATKATAGEISPQERNIATKVYEYILQLAAEEGMDLNTKRNVIQIVFDLLDKRMHPGGSSTEDDPLTTTEGCGSSMPSTQPLPQVTSDYDQDESQMAKSQLYRTAEYASELEQMIHDGEELDAWVQAKITKASDYLSSVKHYLQYKKTKGDQ
jgi:hypothetical protein